MRERVCVCVREIEREKESERVREGEKERKSERERERDQLWQQKNSGGRGSQGVSSKSRESIVKWNYSTVNVENKDFRFLMSTLKKKLYFY